MAELDVFEARFAAACRRYLDEAPTEVDAAEVARLVVALPRAHRLPWAATLRTAPALAWLLLLGVLLATLGGTLLVGSQLWPRLPAIVPPIGPAFTCPPGSNPDKPGPVDQARPSPDRSLTMAFDRRAGRLVALVDAGTGLETWTFDVCTNTWTQMHPNRVPSSSGALVYDTDSNVTILSFKDPDDPFDPDPPVAGVHVWAYDLQTDTWIEKKDAPADAFFFAYDPVSGLVVAGNWDPTVLWKYDVETDTWTPFFPASGPEMLGPVAYDASVDRMVMAGGPDGAMTWLLDLRTGRWSAAGAETPDVIEVFATAPTIIYDEAARRTVLIGDAPRLAAYDATADRWEILAEADSDHAVGFQLHAVDDPVNGRLVGWRTDLDSDELFAFDLVTREWTVLVEATTR